MFGRTKPEPTIAGEIAKLDKDARENGEIVKLESLPQQIRNRIDHEGWRRCNEMEAYHVQEVRRKGNPAPGQEVIYIVKGYIDEKQRQGGQYLNPVPNLLEITVYGDTITSVNFQRLLSGKKEREIDPATIDHSKDSPYRFGGGQG